MQNNCDQRVYEEKYLDSKNLHYALQHRIAQSIESVDNMIQRIQYDPIQYNILNDPYVSLRS